MTARRARLTRRGTIVVLVLLLVCATTAAAVIWKPWESECTVTVGDSSIGLNRAEAEKVSAAVAEVVRQSGTQAQATSAVGNTLDVGDRDAEALAKVLTGRAKNALSCSHGGAGDSESDELDSAGLTARAAAVRSDVARAFGDLPLGGFAPGGVSSGHMKGSAHYEGRAIDVFFRPISSANKRSGWALAHYLVANAARLEINTVIFDGKIWKHGPLGGWGDYEVDRGNRDAATVRILEHRDHVHVDVAD